MLEIIFYIMGILLGMSLLAKLISTITVRKMVKEAAEIQKSNHRLMKLIKAKFEHASLVSDRVQNVSAFVEKYIYEYRVFGMRLNTWRGIPKKGLLLLLILGVFAICESIRMNGISESSIEYIQWTSIFILLLLLVQFVSGENVRLQAARNYIVEYLENVCVHRYAKQHNVTVEELVEEPQSENAPAEINEQETVTDTLVEAETEKGEIQEEEERSQQEMRIRAILEEFLA